MPFKKKIRFFIRFVGAFVKKHYLTLSFGLLLGCFSFFLLPKILKYLPKDKKIIKVGVIGNFNVNEIPETILSELSLGLTVVSENGEPQPALAKSWSVSSDGKVYSFALEDGSIYWHNGQKFVSEDINYNFKDVGVSIEKNNIVFKLKEPFSPFPVVVAKPLFKKGLIGLGKYKVAKITKNGKNIKSILLDPFQNQFLQRKQYRFYQNEDQLKLAFNLGEVDFIDGIIDLKGLNYSTKVNVSQYLAKDVYVAVFFDAEKTIFSEKTVRQALAYAIPKELGEKRVTGPLSPSSWAYNPDVKPYSYDLTKAKSLLGKEGGKQKEKIKISTLPQYENLAKTISENWQKIGLESEIEINSFVPNSFDVLIVGRKIPNDPDQYYFWHSTQAGNISSFKNPRIDKLLEDGRRETGKDERKNIYFDFQRFLIEESPVVFLIHPSFFRLERQ